MDSALHPGQRLGPYQLIKKIGAGGMGDVYEAVEAELNRPVAIKILRNDGSEGASDRKSRFQAEARTLARIQHPNVVSIHSVGEQDGISFLAMEFVKGLPLDRFLLSHPIGLRQLLDLFRQMLEGLAAAHAGGIIHRDLKPQNIMIDEQFKAKLVDFGVAKALSDPMSTNTTAGVVMGTIAYIAPELMRGLPATLQCDIYAMGLVFYYALTGEQPFRGKSTFEVMEQIRTAGIKFSPRSRLFIPELLQKIVLRMTSPSPATRYQSVDQVKAELAQVSVEHLPAEIVSPLSIKMVIQNPDDILAGLKQQSLDTSDYRMVANLALNLQLQRGQVGDKTVNLSAENSIRIEKETLAEALGRFNSLRARISTETFRSQAHRPPSKKSSPPYAMLAVLVSVIAGAAWFGLSKKPAKLQTHSLQERSQVTVPGVVPAQIQKIDRINYPVGFWRKDREREFKDNNLIKDTPRVWKVERKTEHAYVYRGDDGSLSVEYANPFLPPIKKVDKFHGLEEEHTVSGNIMSIFPLRPGTEFTYDIRGMRKYFRYKSATSQFYSVACKVGDKQNTYLMGKDFSTIKVTCQSKGREPEFTDTFYYADEVAYYILRERTEGPYRNMVETMEYHFPNSPISAPADQRQPAQQ